TELVRDCRRDRPATLVIHGHSEGGHTDLGGGVLCGLPGAVEHSLTGEPVEGGCVRGEHCKRRRSADLNIVHFDDLPASVLFLLGCNTISQPGEFFPSTVNLGLAALDRDYDAVIGVSGPSVVPP